MDYLKKENFEQQIKKYEEILAKQNKLFKTIGFIKLIHVLFVAFLIYSIIAQHLNIGLSVLSGVVFVILCAFWIYHEKLKKEIKHSKGMILINQKHLDRISGAWTGFSDIGHEFVDHDHPYSSDLDIVGKKSIFQLLNTTNTWHGRNRFARDLISQDYSDNEIIKRQKAIAELSNDVQYSNELQYRFSEIGVHAGAKSIEARLKNQDKFTTCKLMINLILYMPITVVLFTAFTFVTGIEFLFPIAGSLIMIQLLLWGITYLKTAKYLDGVSNLSYNLDE